MGRPAQGNPPCCTSSRVDADPWLSMSRSRRDGINESELADWRNHNVGFVFQTFNLIPVLTAYENIELPLLLTRLKAGERRVKCRRRSARRAGRPPPSPAAPAIRRSGTTRAIAAAGHDPADRRR